MSCNSARAQPNELKSLISWHISRYIFIPIYIIYRAYIHHIVTWSGAQVTHIMTYQSLYFYTYIHNLPSVYSPYRDLKCLKTLPLMTAGELSSGAVKCGRQLRRWIKQDLRTVNNLYPFPMINLYCFSLLCHKLVIPGALVTYNLTFLG